MALPEFNEFGDLPEGVHQADFDEIVARFGSGSPQREEVTHRLERIRTLAVNTGFLDRLIVFGSYVTSKPDPNDVDVILVMKESFDPKNCSAAQLALFDHGRAHDELRASIFWLRPEMILGEPLDEFIALWQTKRDGGRRGIIEINHDTE